MAPERAEFQTSDGAWRAWVHLGALTLLGGAVDGAIVLSAAEQATFGAAVRHLPDYYFGILPVVAAISVGMLSFGDGALRHATLMVVTVAGAMVLCDLLGGRGGAANTTMATFGHGWVQSSTGGDYTAARLVGTVWRLLHGDIAFPLPRAGRYDPQAPLLVVVFALLKAGHLLLPAGLVGIVLGVQAWITDHVTFRRPVDERVARIVVAWVFAPAGFYLIVSWARELTTQVLFFGASLAVPLLPTGVVLAAGAFGWATARRVAPWAS